MSISMDDVLKEYSAAITSGSAEMLIGAGLSQGVGYPGWDALLQESRARANVPAEVVDAPLVAEYIAHQVGREGFDSLILEPFEKKRSPGRSHKLLGQLADFGLRSVWTTNYDTLLEQVFPDAYRVFHDDDYAGFRKVVRNGRLTKIHGSVGVDRNGIPIWEERPTITRSDYEEYQQEHPILWAELQARFLTNTFLFLGFSFNDPNIEVLLRLGRSLNKRFIRAPHFAIMRREEDQPSQRLQDLRVIDLERAGIYVAYIKDFSEIELFLQDLRRRVLPPALFVSGSSANDYESGSFVRVAEVIHEQAPRVALISMGSRPSYELGSALANVRREVGVNDPELIRFYYRRYEEMLSDEFREVPHPPDQAGTAVYTDYDRERLLLSLLDQTTAFLGIGVGDDRSSTEFRLAVERNIPSFPLDPGGLDDVVVGFSVRTGQVLVETHLGALRVWLNEIFSETRADRPHPSE